MTSRRDSQKRIEFALEAYPCDCLFIHRDAERDPTRIPRREEIQKAIESLECQDAVPHVCVVPIRMTEAWLLFDEAAIQRAAGTPTEKSNSSFRPSRALKTNPTRSNCSTSY